LSHRAGTYSIVARGPEGELGVAVQSHWFSVGSIVSWARAGVGAIATQSVADPGYGPRLLDRLERGAAPQQALGEELAADEEARFRQVGVVDAAGAVAAHTGDGCIVHAGHVEAEGFAVQANMMASPRVWPAMAAAFEGAEGPLARRLLATLEAAEGAGGDVRGRQSAALLVAPATGESWETIVDLRVDDHADPLAELRRLLDLGDAYALADRADALAARGEHAEAASLYEAAAAAAPASAELGFWAGLGIAATGDLDAGAGRVAAAIAADERWGDLLARLQPEIAPAAPAVREALSVPPAGSQPTT
jgi:uncharacterized Ntn-hydrolase superfamily protein